MKLVSLFLCTIHRWFNYAWLFLLLLLLFFIALSILYAVRVQKYKRVSLSTIYNVKWVGKYIHNTKLMCAFKQTNRQTIDNWLKIIINKNGEINSRLDTIEVGQFNVTTINDMHTHFSWPQKYRSFVGIVTARNKFHFIIW